MEEQFARLDKANGSFCLIQAPCLAKAPIVRAYHVELLVQVKQIDYWYLPLADSIFFEQYKYYYQVIADCLSPVVQVHLLEPESRHEFFIGMVTEDEEPGLSRLETLMGFSPPDDNNSSGELPGYTTGNYCLDLEAMLLLFKPAEAQWIRQRFSPAQINQIVAYANHFSREDGEVSPDQQEADRKFFEDHQAAISDQLDDVGAGMLL